MELEAGIRIILRDFELKHGFISPQQLLILVQLCAHDSVAFSQQIFMCILSCIK